MDIIRQESLDIIQHYTTHTLDWFDQIIPTTVPSRDLVIFGVYLGVPLLLLLPLSIIAFTSASVIFLYRGATSGWPMSPAERKRKQLATRETRHSLAKISPENSHGQLQSPLFGVLPPELRNEIFSLVCTQYEDRRRPFPDNAFYYRPGHTAYKRVDTALLLTCRRIYYETKALPLRLATIEIYYPKHRGPPGFVMPNLSRYTRKNIDDFQHVHFFIQECWLRSHIINFWTNIPAFRPKKLTFTIRYSDWSNWEGGEGPRLDLNGIKDSLLPEGLEDLFMEFETSQNHQDELDRLVTRIAQIEFNSRDARTFSTVGSSPQVSSWRGRADLNNMSWIAHGQERMLTYHVVKLHWRPKP